MLNKISLPILLTVMAVLMFVVVLLYGANTGQLDFLKNKNQKQVAVQTKEEKKIVRTDYTEIARKTLDWIDKQRNEEGWYILERGCDYEKKTCDTVWDNKEGNKDGLIATWARLNFYEQHKDPKDLEIVKKDIDIFYDKYKDDNLKDSLWICKIIYEMAQSKYIDQEQKDKLEKICFNNRPSSIDNLKLDIENRIIEMGKTKYDSNPKINWDRYKLVLRGFDFNYGLTTDLISQYLWKKDEDLLSLAKMSFEALKIIDAEVGFPEIENKCLFGISGLDFYQHADKKESNLVYLEEYYQKIIKNAKNNRLVQTPICGLFAKKLYKITKNNKYLVDLEYNNRILTDFNRDGGANKIVSDDGFFKSNFGKIITLQKNVVENSLIIDMIRN